MQGPQNEAHPEYLDIPVGPVVVPRWLLQHKKLGQQKRLLIRLSRDDIPACALNGERISLKEAIMKPRLVAAALFILAVSSARAQCPNIITAKSGFPGRFGEWTTTYDMKNRTFEARHVSGNLITGNVRGTCTDQAVVLEEFNTSNQNDGSCHLNRDGARRFSGKCLPRAFDMRVNGF